jgi:hypothetical protein
MELQVTFVITNGAGLIIDTQQSVTSMCNFRLQLLVKIFQTAIV